MADRFAEDITRRARWVRDHNDGHPKPAWSTGEKIAVALVLRDVEYIAAEGFTMRQAAERLAGDIGDPDVGAWLARVREAL